VVTYAHGVVNLETYDADGNRTKVQDLAGNLTTYACAAKGRLTQDATSGPNAHTYNYTYDSVDNRLTSNEGGTVMTQTYDLSGRLTTCIDGSGVTTYTYDAKGNPTNMHPLAGSIVTMAYDKKNRMTVHKDGATLSTYTYSGDGKKRSEASGATVTTLLWDGSDYVGEV